MSQEEATDGETFKLNRRRIYLHRLVGDDVLQPRTKSTRRTSWRVMLFALYFFIAVFTILSRARVQELSDINVGIEHALQSEPFSLDPVKKDFHDIRTITDMATWLDVAIIGKLVATSTYSNALSLLSFNRVVSLKGVCTDSAAIIMTLRRMSTTTDSSGTTTDRFKALYPRAWMASSLEPGAPGGDFEQTTPLKSKIKSNVSWAHTKKCSVDCDKGLPFGYQDEGGYVAMMTLNDKKGALVHLINRSAKPTSNPDQSICDEIQRSAVVTFGDFVKSGFFDETFGSLALEFVMYNANLQSMSDVLVTLSADNMGLITKKKITTRSIELILEHQVIKYLEVSYLILTAVYFFEFCYRAYRYYPNFFLEVWSYINFISIVCSLISLTLWYVYMPILQDFLLKDDFGQPFKLSKLRGYTQWYLRASAIATLTISLRTIQFLGETTSRVKLLLTTLGISAKNMMLYISYICVIWGGFLAFAFIRFSGKSTHFVTFTDAMLSCFELFLGNNVSLKDLEDTYKVPFFIFFTLFFYFISVQMFNAIINYAYNLVSEQMNPQFEHESRERKRKEMQRMGMNKGMFEQIMDSIRQLPFMPKPEEGAKDKAASEDQKKGGLDDVDAQDKAEHFGGKKDKKGASSESATRIAFFIVFAIAYIWFLYINFEIEQTAAVKDSLLSAIKLQEAGVNMEVADTSGVNGTKSVTRYIDWSVIETLPQVTAWMYGSLVSIMFNTTSNEAVQAAVQSGSQAQGAVCMKSWNCVIQRPSFMNVPSLPPQSPQLSNGASLSTPQPSANGSIGENNASSGSHDSPTNLQLEPSVLPVSPPWAQAKLNTLIRITQRRSKRFENSGATSPEDIAADWAFSGGEDPTLKQNRSKLLVPYRLGTVPPEVSGSPSNDEDVDLNFALDLDGRPLCRSKKVDEGGYLLKGGIVCMLDADYGTFVKQMRTMFESDFYTTQSSTFVVDFVAYNGNQNILVYILVSFRVRASGVVDKHASVSTMKLFDLGTFFDDAWPIVLRLFPGLVYLFLVFKFGLDLFHDWQQEVYRKKLSMGNTTLATTIEFFAQDIFNALEIVSIGISLISAVLFILWLAEDGKLVDKLDGSHEDLLDYASVLANQNKLYNNLSAINVLIIFVRPLKFMRSSIRMANLYETLYEAKTDICWFVVMFAVTLFGFVMFAHVCFGPAFFRCRTLISTFAYCFNYVLGNFDVTPLLAADGFMAVIFFVPFLLLFYCVFLNIFFAIVDRHFMPAEPPPFNWKRYLKPFFHKICRCIEWDEDYAMEQEPKDGDSDNKENSTRQTKVKATQEEIQRIEEKARENVLSLCPKNSKILNEVCDLDERMSDVLQWGREESQKLVSDFTRLLNKKHSVKNDDVFIKQEINRLKTESRQLRDEMMDSERHMRYSTKVHEQMAQRDQETLAKYVLMLESKIKAKMGEKHTLETEVLHLKAECDGMRYTPEEMKQALESSHERFDSSNALGDRQDNPPQDPAEAVDQLALLEETRASGAAGGAGISSRQPSPREAVSESGRRPGLGEEGNKREMRDQQRNEKTDALLEGFGATR